MYFPILRGKQFELIALRELCSQAPEVFARIKPVIEPVTQNWKPLIKTLEVLNEIDVKPLMILNPSVGELDSQIINYDDSLSGKIIPTLHLTYDNEEKVIRKAQEIGVENIAVLVPDGCSNTAIKSLKDAKYLIISTSLTQAKRHSDGVNSSVILLEDGFQRQERNADYQKSSKFKSAIAEYKSFDLGGFSDYTITGQFYRDSGGPAYVVAIHVSELKEEQDDFGPEVTLLVNHYISDFKSDSPKDPAAKFNSALKKMFYDVDSRPHHFENTIGLSGFRELYDTKHFSGLGVAKKYSVLHHMQTLANYVQRHD